MLGLSPAMETCEVRLRRSPIRLSFAAANVFLHPMMPKAAVADVVAKNCRLATGDIFLFMLLSFILAFTFW
jgi:hypothetical protein